MKKTIVLFLLPVLIVYTLIVIWPLLYMIGISFVKWNGIPTIDKIFVGFSNYVYIITNRAFLYSLLNNVIWSLIIFILLVGLGFIIAVLLSGLISDTTRTVMQTIYFLPVIQAPVATAVIWRWIYQPNGALNQFIQSILPNFPDFGWLGDKYLALPMLAISHVWGQMGLSIVIFLTGLQAIDPGIYESARIEGATGYQKLRHITIPSMTATITTVSILALSQAVKAFALVLATTNGGPAGATEILATYVYKLGLTKAKYGEGAAASIYILIIMVAVNLIFVNKQNKQEKANR